MKFLKQISLKVDVNYRFPSLFAGVTFPRNLESANTKTIILSLKQAKSVFFPLLSAVFGPRIVETANGKTANNECRLYCIFHNSVKQLYKSKNERGREKEGGRGLEKSN